MEIKKLKSSEIADFKALIDVLLRVFESPDEMPDDQYLKELLSNRDFMAFVVKINDKVVGGLTVYVLPRYVGSQPIAYIYDVGMDPDFQRKGFGQALLREVCQFCKINGFEYAYVEAESDDTEAVNFYRKTGANHELKAIHFTYLFK
jgi:aminoglycoside 3-N-acetyltransferase I